MSSTPYNPVEYVPYPNAIPINGEYTFTASMATSVGDLLWFDATVNTLKPVSQIPDQGSAALTQALAASLFCGLSNGQQLSTDATARQAKFCIDLEVEFSCVSGTFNPGDYVTFVYSSTGVGVVGALADQQVTKTSNPALAIGRVVRQYTSNTTVVRVRMTSRLFAGFLADHVWATNNQAAPGNPNSANGSAMSETAGAGYAATTGTAGNGGAGSTTGGVGGSATSGTGGTGGAVSAVGGAGGAVSTGTAGVGGTAALTGGAGGAATGAATTGGAGAAATVTGGVGGATSGSGASPGGSGGSVTVIGGAGGAAGAGTGNGGAGGNLTLNAGIGGTTTGGSAGAAGNVKIANNIALPSAGASSAFIQISSTASFGIYFGSGAPTVSAAQGSIYLRSDGSSTSTRLYVNTTGSTTWTGVTTGA